MSPLDAAWAILKVDFEFDDSREAQLGPKAYYTIDADTGRLENANVNLAHEMWPIVTPNYDMGHAKFGKRFDEETGEHRNMSWDNYNPAVHDEGLMNQVIDSVAHEGTHEAIQNTPEAQEAFRNALREWDAGNKIPMIQFHLVQELMASRHDPHEALRHPLWGRDRRMIDEERKKVRSYVQPVELDDYFHTSMY